MADETLTQTTVRLLVYLRRFILETAILFLGLTSLFYFISPYILPLLQEHLAQHLAFFGVMEPVVAMLKLSALIALAVLAPWIFYRVSQGLVAVVGVTRSFARGFTVAALALFYAGATFCFFVTLPFGINFLLGYQSEHVKPVIAIGKFVDFVTFFILGFGLIFELPLIMILLCRLGICSYKTFGQYRRYAVLVIAVLAAMLTPTPDIFNMSLMGIPLYLLYEAGIVVSRLVSPAASKTSYNTPRESDNKT